VAVIADIDTVLLGFLSDNKSVGLFTAAVKLSKISIPIVTSMGVILMPRIAKEFADGDMGKVQATLNQTFSFLVFLGVPITAGLALLAPDFIALFSGDEFLAATNSMRLLSLLPLIMGFAHFFLFLILVPSGRNKEMFIAEVAGLIISLCLNFLLIPVLKQTGAAIADICSESVIAVVYFYYIKKHFSFSYQWSLLLQSVVCAVLFVPVIWMVKELSLGIIYRVLAAITLCAITYITVQLVVFKNRFVFTIVDFFKMKLSKTDNG
jgi:O-antigen/teichoic acid export membrane protein